jgi:hypothetical protein
MTTTYSIAEIAYAEDEVLVLVEGADPLPDFHTIQRHLPAEVQALTFRAYLPGGAAGSTAPYSDMWVLSA